MSLAVFNGSPRGKKSNSSIIIGWFLSKYSKENTIYTLNQFKKINEHIEGFVEAEQVLMVFPLYVDGMPGQVKAFFEGLLPYKEQVRGKKITFIIHSGFQEGIQNRALETYLNRFSDILQLNNHGVIVIPGSEGFRLMPPAMTKKKAELVSELAHSFELNQPYSKLMLNKLAPTETMSTMRKLGFRFFKLLGLTNIYWNQNLKKNHVYKNRFDAPYDKNPVDITTDAYLKNY